MPEYIEQERIAKLEAQVESLKDDVKEVLSGFVCGIGIEGYRDL